MDEIKITVAQMGSRQGYMLPLALQQAGILRKFYTDLYLKPFEAKILARVNHGKRFSDKVLRAMSRFNPMLDSSKIKRFPSIGLAYYFALNRARNNQAKYRAYIDYGYRFNQAIIEDEFAATEVLLAFDHAALKLLQHNKFANSLKILDQVYPGSYAEKLEYEEQSLWHDWLFERKDIEFYGSDIYHEWCDIEMAEWHMADLILAASEYTKRGMLEICPTIEGKVRVVPLASMWQSERNGCIRSFPKNRPLRVLFAGNVNILKGIPYLLDAFRLLNKNQVILIVAGRLDINPARLRHFEDFVDFRGAVPRLLMPNLYAEADVFVFPTISDGFGVVQLEAMASGLPVIATENCGDVVEDGINGFRVPIRQPEAIVEAIMRIVKTPDLLSHLSLGALRTVEKYSWGNYVANLLYAMQSLSGVSSGAQLQSLSQDC